MTEYIPLYIDVITRELNKPDSESVKRIDYHSKKAREWLAKHCYWAFTNNHAVMTAKSENQERA